MIRTFELWSCECDVLQGVWRTSRESKSLLNHSSGDSGDPAEETSVKRPMRAATAKSGQERKYGVRSASAVAGIREVWEPRTQSSDSESPSHLIHRKPGRTSRQTRSICRVDNPLCPRNTLYLTRGIRISGHKVGLGSLDSVVSAVRA